jgi:hypothetical protein
MNRRHRNNRRFSTILVFLFCFSVLLIGPVPTIGHGESRHYAAFIERYGSGAIDWDAGIIYGRGVAYVEDQKGNRYMAQRGAQVMAAANILRLAAGIRVDDHRLLGDLGDGQVVIRLKAHLMVSDHSARFVENNGKPYYEVVRKAHITGIHGLTRQLLTRYGDSLSEGLQWPSTPPSAGPQSFSDDSAPWLVLDARHLARSGAVSPALLPQIKTAGGDILYDWRRVMPSALEHRGMARYVVSDVAARRWRSSRTVDESLLGWLSPTAALAQQPAAPASKGRRRYIVKKVTAAEGLSRTNLVISDRDAQALAKEDAASQILKKCRVIVIVNSPIGGVEGALPGDAPPVPAGRPNPS